MKLSRRSFARTLVIGLIAIGLSACAAIEDNNANYAGEKGEKGEKGENREKGGVLIESAPPNILLILLDDLAYTDLGVFGGEIGTPNIDALAREGVQLTNFYMGSTCSPSRAMLMSGTDNHLAGLGYMEELMTDEQRGKPGYEGYLNFNVVALPELLSDAGYNTYMVGKWHLGKEERTSPAARGFKRSFSLDDGGAGHFDDLAVYGRSKAARASFREDGRKTVWPVGKYSSEFYTEKIIEYIESGQANDKPFFAYVAYTAPHFPLQAPAESIAKYKGAYDAGYEVLAQQRLKRVKELGLVAEDVTYDSTWHPNWGMLTDQEKKEAARAMEIYAAMVNDVDYYIGQLIEYLRESGELENTAILLMSDNGAEGEDYPPGSFLGDWVALCCDNSYENMGKPDSYIWYGPNWAKAGVVPLKKHKSYTTDGGLKAPALITYKGLGDPGSRNNSFSTVLDVMPTILELAGLDHPGIRYKGRDVQPSRGRSMLGALRGEVPEVHPTGSYMGWEYKGRRAIREGDWKLYWQTDKEGGHWELYNVRNDPAEQQDLFNQEQEIAQRLIGYWDEYFRETGIIFPRKTAGKAH